MPRIDETGFFVEQFFTTCYCHVKMSFPDLSIDAGDGARAAMSPYRTSFSQEHMQYLDQEGTVIYTSKDGETTKSFPALV
ncbi:MAG: hypothetical protein Q7J31_17180 [Syntrophales bacterium]|nr:hypothetical protein [Syntrophales bacterium]